MPRSKDYDPKEEDVKDYLKDKKIDYVIHNSLIHGALL